MKVPMRYVSLVVLLIAAPVSAWAIAYRPMNTAVHTVADEIRQRTSRLANYDEINMQYREMKTISESLQKVSDQTMERIPLSHNAEQWLESASDAALSFGLIVNAVTTSGERTEGDYKILPVDFNVRGGFPSVYKLLQHLEQMHRLSRIDTLTVHRVDDEIVEARLVIHLVFGTGETQ